MKTCMLDFWATEQVFAFQFSMFQDGLRDPQGCCETNREKLIMLSNAQHTKLLRAGPHHTVALTTKLWYS